jgi:hypothetical protein
MALWIDKYRPQTLDRMDYHVEQAQSLKQMVRLGDDGHGRVGFVRTGSRTDNPTAVDKCR